MPTLAEVKRQIEQCPGKYIFWTGREVRALPDILGDDESIRGITSGMMDGFTWLAVCTNKRLIFVNRGMFWGMRQVQLPLDRIQSIDHEFTIAFGSIRVWDGASYFTIRMVLKNSITPFVKATQEAMYAYRNALQRGAAQHNAHAMAGAAAKPDIASQLAILAELKEKGHLTEEEFQAQKKKLLG